MEFLANNLVMILCFAGGFALLLLEAFMPGFGVAGVSGFVLEVIAIYSAWAHHGFLFGLCATLAVLLLIGLTVFFSYRSAVKGRLSRSSLILKEEESAGPDRAASLAEYLNREGTAVSSLRPGGFVETDGVRLNAASSGDFIEKGTAVRIVGAEGDHVIVRPL